MTQTGTSSKSKIFPNRGKQAVLLICALLLLPMTASAEALYVSDNLRVGVRDSAEENANTLTVITSGSQVELLDRNGSYIKVRASNGVEGWVKSAYFSKDKPSRLLLMETKNRLRQVEEELAQSRSSKNQNDPQVSQLRAEISQLKSREADLQQLLLQAQENPTSVGSAVSGSINLREALGNNGKLLLTSLATLMVFLCMGFLIGVSWHKRQVTKRLGGLTL